MTSFLSSLRNRITVLNCRGLSTQPDVDIPSERLNSALRYLNLDEQVSEAINEGRLLPSHHPGRMKFGIQTLPSELKSAIESKMEGKNQMEIAAQGKRLLNQLWGRHLPNEERQIHQAVGMELDKIQSSINATVDSAALDDVEYTKLQKLAKDLSLKKVKQVIHPWKPLNPDHNTCLLYLVSRTPAEFAVLHKIFSEIKIRDMEFIPQTFFDFGSGVGSGFWALREVWKKPLLEAFHVDVNVTMNDLAHSLIMDNVHDSASKLGLFFRQFLPSSPDPTYDLVLSAFSLLELPSMKDRIETISKLWQKTNNYLVIVEDGSRAGFNVVAEARQFLTQISKDIPNVTHTSVFAPCSHDLQCPSVLLGKRPCNFEVKYWMLPYLHGSQKLVDHSYSYLVIRRGPQLDIKWPRCVHHTTKSAKLVQLKVCTPDGRLGTALLSKGKNSRNSYRCSRKTEWGDLLPGELYESEEDFRIKTNQK